MALVMNALAASTRLVDCSASVPSLADATRFWTAVMGLELVATGGTSAAPWAIMADPHTDQRLCLVERDDEDRPFALTLEIRGAREFDGAVSALEKLGCRVADRGDQLGNRWALVRDRSFLPLLLTELDEDAESPHEGEATESIIAPAERPGIVLDTVVAVDDVSRAVDFWGEYLGMEEVDRGEIAAYVSMLHRGSGQMLTVIEGERAGSWWLGVCVDDLNRACRLFTDGGGVIDRRGRLDGGFQYAIGKAVGEVPVMLHTDHVH